MQPFTTASSSRPSVKNVAWRLFAGAISLAAAAQCHGQVLSDPQRAWQPDPQQRVALTVHSEVVRQPLGWQPRGGIAELQTVPTRQASLGLEFRRASSAQSARDLLKVQLTADSVLNFRPRGGGLAITYRSQF